MATKLDRDTKDSHALEQLDAALRDLGPDELTVLLRLGRRLPVDWRQWPPKRCLEYLRCRFKFTQEELGRKAGVAQSLVSRIEGGAPALLGTWSKLFRAMGFDLVLLPVSDLSEKELHRKAEEGRPQGHWMRMRARPRRRWMELHAREREAARGNSRSP